MGSNISPIRPISKAINLGLVLSDSSTDCFETFIASSITSSTLYPNLFNLISFAPNVFVVITFAPDSRYSLCIFKSLSGFLNPNTSVFHLFLILLLAT